MDIGFLRVVFIIGFLLGFAAGVLLKEALIDYKVIKQKIMSKIFKLALLKKYRI